ncbi:phage tail tube protein [Allokutzneria sp. A3M-2-11 16]|uniref:phage tail tube protein n=1 Tax=Allokutzneria sp. A3M-2-11 16 TaxID=2962043 RepID=UPI0020B8F8D8|nr:phage tail tube protein [Allokutzneria sp. A3M-2-11 16]MCP3805374.1 phage tail tube protein [Allokutzneria sp. A3M-2-11 16]
MPIPSGLSAQIGCAEESTYGTPVTVDRFYEFRSESLAMSIERIESQALRPGTRLTRSDDWSSGQKSVGGDVSLELTNKSFGRLFKHMFGGLVTSQPNAGTDPTVYLHTFTLGDIPVGMTWQVGRPDVSGTVRAFTYHGCRVGSWNLECSVGEIATLGLSLIGEDEDTGTALATASYPTSPTLMTFVHGSLSLAGSAHSVKSASVEGNNGLADDRYFLGTQLRKAPLEAALREYTGTLESEFESLTAYNRFINGTEAEMILLFQGATISNAYKFETKITANVRFDGETPGVSGTEILQQPLPYKVVDNGTTSIKVEYQTTDTTP